MKLFDAHNHLQDARLAGEVAEAERIGLAGAVVNGTQEEDWEVVRIFAGRHPWARPSYGLHPWYLAGRSARWLGALEERLRAEPHAAVGEIGLDRWIEGHDLPAQLEVFAAQLALAARLERPVTIHCLKAWGALEEQMRTRPAASHGFLIHAYGGPAEMVESFAKRGAYFSFSAYFLAERKEAAREVFRQVPLDRLLVETDAPDMLPPEDLDRYTLRDPASGARLNHPGNLLLAYEALARLREMPVAELAGAAEKNFAALFG